MSPFDEQFRSMKKKIHLNDVEKDEILAQVNERIARKNTKSTFQSWKYVASLATAFTLIFIISFSIIEQKLPTPTEETSTFVSEMNEEAPNVAITDQVLPPNTSFVQSEHIEPIQFYDFNQDGVLEAIVLYERKGEVEPSPSQYGIIVLQRDDESAGGWQKIWEKETEGVGLHFAELVDITEDGVSEILFGVTIGASVGNQLEIFQWENETLQPLYDIYYHQLEVVKNDRTGLAVWDRFLADTYLVQVVSWNGEELVFDEQLFAKYYPTIKEFYEKKLEYMDAWFYWYVLADAQLKANLLKEAKNSIEHGIRLAEKEQLSEAIESLQKLQEQLGKKEKD